MLFPEFKLLIEEISAFESVSMILIISFLNGHPVYLFEKIFLDKLWERLYKNYNIRSRDGIYNRSKIIANAEINKIKYSYYDQTLGEFILFTNTSVWIFFLSITSLFLKSETRPPFMINLIILIITIIAIVFVCPIYKKNYLDILDEINLKLVYIK